MLKSAILPLHDIMLGATMGCSPVVDGLVCRAALCQLAADEGWPEGWVFDGRKNIYVCLQPAAGVEVLTVPVSRLQLIELTLPMMNVSELL